MKRKIVVIITIILLAFVPISPLTFSVNTQQLNETQENTQANITSDEDSSLRTYPIMELNKETIKTWDREYQQLKKAPINPALQATIAQTEDYDILDYVDYVPSEHDQHWCGNCWAWPATSIIGIALFVQEGIFDRLSVQYINSCGTIVGVDCCEGGNLDIFAQFYRQTDKAIPWSNENAEWKDKYAQCNTPCGSIETEPNYPISAIYPERIETHDVSEETAIENIKNILHQEKGVYFSWYLPDMDYRSDFSSFWQDDSEDIVYDIDWACGSDFDEETGGGHAILCVGYHDEEGTDNDYWIMLNSWGTTSRRPNGLFRINMHMNYDCTLFFDGREYYSINFQTLDINFGTEDESPDPPTINGPSSGRIDTEYTYTFSTIDYQNDSVYIMIDWGDDEITDWIGPLESGEIIQRNHTWSAGDTYALRAKAKDEHDKESLWANFEISMSRNKKVSMNLFDFLFEYIKIFSFLKQFIT